MSNEWKSVGVGHYSILIQKIIVGYFHRFASNQWRVYYFMNDEFVVVGDYDEEAYAQSIAKLKASELQLRYGGKPDGKA